LSLNYGLWKRALSDFDITTDIVKTENDSITIYPNPAKDHLWINIANYSENQNYSVKIIDQLGTTVFESRVTQPQYEINTSRWSGKGIYVLQVYDGNKIIKASKKIIFQ
jgi:hypothetical protein